VTASLKPEEIYQILVRRVAQGLNISRCSIIIAGPDDDHGTVVAAYENPMLHNLAVDLRRYPEIQHSLTTGELVLVRDVLTDPMFQGMRAIWESEGRVVPARSAIALRPAPVAKLLEHAAGEAFQRFKPCFHILSAACCSPVSSPRTPPQTCRHRRPARPNPQPLKAEQSRWSRSPSCSTPPARWVR
jgi:hypothetical protein